MLTIRKASERGATDLGWLDSRHTFSFGDYYDPRQLGYGPLRVINDDRVEPGGGFGTHPHRDMEIISYVLEGGLAHQDSMGTGSTIRPGDVQRMSAGTGVLHSEHNASKREPVHFLQIWIVPRARGLTPGYEQKRFAEAEKRGRLRLIASEDGHEGSVTVHQDARVYVGLFDGPEAATLDLAPGRRAWVQVARGTLEVNGTPVGAGDGVAVSDERKIELASGRAAEVLVFDLP